MPGTDTAPARESPPPLPDTERLRSIWTDPDTPVTLIEYAAQDLHVLWSGYFAEMAGATAEEFLASPRCRAADTTSAVISRLIDDGLTVSLGNRTESVTMIADDATEHTVGELIVAITVLALLLDRWKRDNHGAESPHAHVFVRAVRDYEQLRAALAAGDRRQPRRVSHGLPPVEPTYPIPFPAPGDLHSFRATTIPLKEDIR